jgi:hypothetical protein
MKKNERLKQIACYIEGTLSADGVKDLEAALQQDTELRRDFLEYLNIDAAMAEIAALPDSETVEVCGRSVQVRRRLYLKLLVLAASVLFVVSLLLFIKNNGGQDTTSEVIAKVLYAENLHIEGHVPEVQVGDRLKLSHVQLRRGLLGLELPTGVKLELMAPLTGDFAGPTRLHLISGRLNADVGKNGKGFTVATQAGELVDLGTEFGVDVTEDSDTRVAVFSGQVNVKAAKRAKASNSLTMLDGEALCLQKGEKSSRLSSVNIRAHKMELDSAGTSDLIESVTDNIKDKKFRKFYGIVTKGMAEGTIAYTNRPGVVWMAKPDTPFPRQLLGADVVCPFHVDRNRNDLNITLYLKQPSIVYVLWDKGRRPLPWLKDTFKRTNIRLYSGPWGSPTMPVVRGVKPDAQGRILLEYTVWCREVLQSGPFTLGPPHVRVGRRRRGFAMYGIAVKPLNKTLMSPQLSEEPGEGLVSTDAPLL